MRHARFAGWRRPRRRRRDRRWTHTISTTPPPRARAVASRRSTRAAARPFAAQNGGASLGARLPVTPHAPLDIHWRGVIYISSSYSDPPKQVRGRTAHLVPCTLWCFHSHRWSSRSAPQVTRAFPELAGGAGTGFAAIDSLRVAGWGSSYGYLHVVRITRILVANHQCCRSVGCSIGTEHLRRSPMRRCNVRMCTSL